MNDKKRAGKSIETVAAGRKARNLVRGALAMLKMPSTPDAKRLYWIQERRANYQIHRAIGLAKKHLTKIEEAEFEEWVTETVASQRRDMQKLGTSLTSLGTIPAPINSQSLPDEIGLAVEALLRDLPRLLDFGAAVRQFSDAFQDRDWAGALKVVNAVVAEHGYSFWNVENTLGLIQLSQGGEAVKAEVLRLSNYAAPSSLFFLYFFGTRNEPAQTSARFKVQIRKRIEDSDLDDDLKAYFKFRLYGELDLSSKKLADVLASERLTTTIDLLFTVIKVIHWIRTNPTAFPETTLMAGNRASAALEPLLRLLGLDSSFTSKAVASIEDVSNSFGELNLVACAASESLDVLFGGTEGVTKRHLEIDQFLLQGLASQLSTRSDRVNAEELVKTQLNFPTLASLIQLGDVSEVPTVVELLLDVVGSGSNGDGKSNTIKQAILSELGVAIFGEEKLSILYEPYQLLRSAMNLRADGDFESAIELLLRQAGGTSNMLCRDIFHVLAANLQFECGDLIACVRTMSVAGFENDRLLSNLPMTQLFQGTKWSRIKHIGPSVEFSIALDLYLRLVEDRAVKTYKRYSVEEMMTSHGVTSVDALVPILAKTNELRLVEYFFYNVCDVGTLELLPGVGESRKAQKLRADVLRALAKLGSENLVNYIQVADEIEETLAVNDGLDMLDDSKVYVDEQTVENSIVKELADDFQRYLKLIESGIGTSASFAEVLQSLKNPSAKTFQIPRNDADDLLGEMVAGILDKFLFDPVAGLDTTVGRSIRHGTIASELRGRLEAVGLIGQRPRAGAAYLPHERIVQLCAPLELKKRKMVFAAFARFSEGVDHLVSNLRDEIFHVNSKSKPKGIFLLQVNVVVLALARSLAMTCNSVDQFSRQCQQIFWSSLSLTLRSARVDTESSTKRSVAALFSKLVKELHSLGMTDASLFSRIQQGSEELQRGAITIASWIRVPRAGEQGNTYSMQKTVDVAVAMVTGQRPGFLPKISTSVPSNLELDTHGFRIVVDALYIALDNVGQHSGKKVDNKVQIEILYHESKKIISFEVSSELGPGVKPADRESRLSTIRSNIQKKAYRERARSDRGGSGLYKLAAIVMQSDATEISFKFDESNRFVLHFDLIYVSSVRANSRLTDLAPEAIDFAEIPV